MRVSFPGGSYVEARPTGEYACLFPGSHISSHLGVLPLAGDGRPNQDVLFLRITLSGEFKIAGQGQRDGLTWEWAQGQWTTRGPTHGVSPVIYANDGTLLVIRPPAPGQEQTSQGYRYVDVAGRVWLGDETYFDAARLIWEYTTLGVTVGQGESGCHVLTPQHRMLEPGNTRFVRYAAVDGRHAVAIVKPGEACVHTLSTAELLALPLVDAPPVDPPIDPPIDPPTGGSGMVPNRAEALQSFWQMFNHAQFITDLDEKHRFTEGFCQWLNATDDPPHAGRYGRKSRESSPGLKSKDTVGYWRGSPVPTADTNGRLDAVDIIGSDGRVSWDTRAEQGDPDYANIQALWMPVPAYVVDPPGGGDPPDAGLTARVAALEEKVEALRREAADARAANDRQDAMLAAHGRDIQALQAGGGTGSGLNPGDMIEIANQTSTGRGGSPFTHSHPHDIIRGVIRKL